MTFKDLTTEVVNYLRVQGAENVELIKGFINESVMDFLKTDEWKKVRASEAIPLTGTGSFDLTTLTTGIFFGEIELINAGNTNDYLKIDYKTYLKALDKTNYFAIFGSTLYVQGDGVSPTLVFLDYGLEYPLTADDDEVPATLHYWDIIKKMAVIYFLDYISDFETVTQEENKLLYKLQITQKSENRIAKNGKLKLIRRGFQ